MTTEATELANVVPPSHDKDQTVETFAHKLAASCGTHTQWLSVMRYGLGTLLKDQQLLITLIDQEANREVRRGATPEYALPRIFSELKLRVEIIGE
jgi:hypothetical protein